MLIGDARCTCCLLNQVSSTTNSSVHVHHSFKASDPIQESYDLMTDAWSSIQGGSGIPFRYRSNAPITRAASADYAREAPQKKGTRAALILNQIPAHNNSLFPSGSLLGVQKTFPRVCETASWVWQTSSSVRLP
ncbi:hypothetical protein RRG08_004783 [Elysia crispata]|uniref:Uncharacterized protein n=1 Tax=Elysia crispata TaxID=231223 RepID=A0AAE1E0L9_9GAST|nr:hypothetical protein RRG08_004783 [Elysia crispata]